MVLRFLAWVSKESYPLDDRSFVGVCLLEQKRSSNVVSVAIPTVTREHGRSKGYLSKVPLKFHNS